MVKKTIFLLMLLSIFAPFLLSQPASGQEEELALVAKSAMILFMHGDVKVKPGAAGWQDAAVEMVLSEHDSLKTGPDSWAEIGFGEDFVNVIRVKENTLVELIALAPIKIGLLKGEVRALVESLDANTTFEIRTPTAVCGARGTGWDTNTDGKIVVVDVYEERVFLTPLSEQAKTPSIIKAGKSGILRDPARAIEIKDIAGKKVKDWKRWKGAFKKRRIIAGRRVSKDIGGAKEIVEKTDRTQRNVEGVLKGKEGLFEKREQEKLQERLDEQTRTSSGASRN